MDKLAELVDKCASTRGAPAAAELFQHIAELLSEDVERDARLDGSLRAALVRVARAGAAARSNNPRAALALLDGAWLRCRDERDRATLLAEAERLHAAAVAASTYEAAELDAWPDAADAAPPSNTTVPRGERGNHPVVYERAVAAWSAVTRWRSPSYWIAELGARIVPVEVGVAHRDSDLAQQRLVPFGEYVDSVLLPLARGEAASLGGNVCAVSAVVPVTSARTVAYLAQHPLLAQCPQLARDAGPWPRFVQDAIARGPRAQRGLELIVSAWVAPRGATTPLHYDRHPNYLFHLVGRKLVYLWPPDAPIPRNAPPAENTSPLDAASLVDACELRADLRPGDVLFIPEGWWHYVVTPVTSVSVSVWF
jgi:lysine-specific demethylase 8